MDCLEGNEMKVICSIIRRVFIVWYNFELVRDGFGFWMGEIKMNKNYE